jgi:hypothetical protein
MSPITRPEAGSALLDRSYKGFFSRIVFLDEILPTAHFSQPCHQENWIGREESGDLTLSFIVNQMDIK